MSVPLNQNVCAFKVIPTVCYKYINLFKILFKLLLKNKYLHSINLTDLFFFSQIIRIGL